jgi:type VI protein secretion system component VasF
VQVKRNCSWEAEANRELDRRWREYKRRQSYRYATAWVFAGLFIAVWLIYWIARIMLHR